MSNGEIGYSTIQEWEQSASRGRDTQRQHPRKGIRMNLKTITALLMLAMPANAQSIKPEPHAATVTDISNRAATGGAKYTFDCSSCPGPHPVTVWLMKEPTGVSVGGSVILWDDPGVEGLKLLHIDWKPK